MPAHEIVRALTEKEKQTLRLIVRGHDAKSIARSLGLSVHTINERLRDARRKLAVSSSREAARLLLECEGEQPVPIIPQSRTDTRIGVDSVGADADEKAASADGARRLGRRSITMIGAFVMTLCLGLLALAAVPQPASVPPAPTAPVAAEYRNTEVIEAARQWLELVDQARWTDSYQAAAASFRALNTTERWIAASEKVRIPLGAAISRVFVSQENLPAPPHGYEVVKFRTRFANKTEAVETVALDQEEGRWRVTGVTIG